MGAERALWKTSPHSASHGSGTLPHHPGGVHVTAWPMLHAEGGHAYLQLLADVVVTVRRAKTMHDALIPVSTSRWVARAQFRRLAYQAHRSAEGSPTL